MRKSEESSCQNALRPNRLQNKDGETVSLLEIFLKKSLTVFRVGFNFTHSTFVELCEDLFDKTMRLVDKAIQEAGLAKVSGVYDVREENICRKILTKSCWLADRLECCMSRLCCPTIFPIRRFGLTQNRILQLRKERPLWFVHSASVNVYAIRASGCESDWSNRNKIH